MSGTLLGLDWGQRKVGYATSDAEGIVVSPRGNFKRKASKEEVWMLQPDDLKNLTRIVDEFEVEKIVLGLPLLAGGHESGVSEQARVFGDNLKVALGRPVELVSETLTSWDARNYRGVDEDAQAAALLLQDYFSARERLGSRRGGVISYLLALLIIFATLVGGYFYYPFMSFPMKDGNGSFTVDILPGSSFSDLRASFAKEGVTVDKYALKIWMIFSGEQKTTLKVGEFLLHNDWTTARAFDEILHGVPIMHKVVVKEGHNIYDIQNELATAKDPAAARDFLALVRDPKLLASAGIPSTVNEKLRSLEGFLFPETYAFSKYDPTAKIVKSMLEQFRVRALPILQEHPWGKSPDGLYKLLILASIVEKESGNKDEQPLVASVFWNRIEKKMRLQSDPTTIYGLLPHFDGNIRKKDLLSPTPFNTYTLSGLPATPISNPGETALRAVVHPASTKFLYFVGRGDGTHLFSEDFKTHNRYVDEYQRKRKATTR